MGYIEQTKRLVEDIKNQQEELYKSTNLSFNIETPTVIEYYKNSLQKGNFNFKKRDPFSVKYDLLLGIKASGWASNNSNNICVLAKNHQTFTHFLTLPVNELSKHLPYHDIAIAHTTLHEIRHIVQNSGYYLSAYEYFCCRNLSDYKGLKGLANKRFHDSLYAEIDANLYGAIESKIYFHGNKNIEKYFDKLIGKYSIQRITYDFDTELEKYQQENENNGYKLGGIAAFEEFIWNHNGTFKRPKEILSQEELYQFLNKYPEVRSFYSKIISSTAYLQRLNRDELDNDEINFIKDAIKDNNRLLQMDKDELEYMYKNNMITEKEYKNSISVIDKRIDKKEKIGSALTKDRDITKEIEKQEEKKMIDPIIEALIQNMTTPEPPKKISIVTKAKSRLKSVIDYVGKVRVGVLVYALTLLGNGIVNPSMYLNSATDATELAKAYITFGAALGAGAIAHEIHKHNSSRK